MKHRHHYIKFTDEVKRTVHRLIVYGQYSPEQIAERFTMRGEEMVCKEIICKWIWKERKNNDEMAIDALAPNKDMIHTNGFARQYISKGSDFDLYSEENIAEIEWKLNHRPRKLLCYLTPLEYYK